MKNVQSKTPHPSCSWNNRSSKIHENTDKFCSWLKAFCKGFGLLLTYEIIEELIEEAIAYTITTVIAKAVSFLLVVVLTQTVKVTAKGLAKGLVIVLKPLVKNFTYREGNDKINKILRVIDMCKKNIKGNKFLNFLKRNPKSIIAMLAGLVASIATGGATTCGLVIGKVELPLWANIVVGVIICIVEFVFIFIGVKDAGFESNAKYQMRKVAEKIGFERAYDEIAKVGEAFEAEEKAKEEAEKEAAERAKEKYLEGFRIAVAEQSYDGSLEDYIAAQQKLEKEKEDAIKEAEAEEKERVARANFRIAVTEQGYTGSFADWKAEQANK